MRIILKYEGNLSEEHALDFYDASQALVGLQRSLALTTHLCINGTIITQAPALKGAAIYVEAPRAGSWTLAATVMIGGAVLYKLGTAPKTTPIGHLSYSLYDYALKKLTGQHVDYERSIGQMVEDANRQRRAEGSPLVLLPEERIDSLLEKIEPAVKDVHRPIVKSRTAEHAFIDPQGTMFQPLEINEDTYKTLISSTRDDTPQEFVGKVSSYNTNTFKGRIYLRGEKRPIPFELADVARGAQDISLITSSLRAVARDRLADGSEVTLIAFTNRSKTKRLKSLLVLEVDAV